MRRLVLLALPGLLLAGVGLVHPHRLDHGTSLLWFGVHVPGLLVFPLVGVALAALVSGRSDLLAWLVRATAYGYATFYTALDVVSGMAAGWVTHRLGPGVPRPDEVRLLFELGTPLGRIGSWSLVACCLLIVGDRAARRSRAAWAGLLLLPGAWLIHVDHIFSPLGAAGAALVGLGTAAALIKPGGVVTGHGSQAS